MIVIFHEKWSWSLLSSNLKPFYNWLFFLPIRLIIWMLQLWLYTIFSTSKLYWSAFPVQFTFKKYLPAVRSSVGTLDLHLHYAEAFIMMHILSSSGEWAQQLQHHGGLVALGLQVLVPWPRIKASLIPPVWSTFTHLIIQWLLGYSQSCTSIIIYSDIHTKNRLLLVV